MKSYIGTISTTNTSYALQYQDAFEYLYNNRSKIISEAKLCDIPLIYLLRHYLELSFKYNIEYFKDYSNTNELVSNLYATHDLNKLYPAFKKHFDESISTFINSDDELKNKIKLYFKNLKKLNDKIIELDNYSVSFRYSHNKDGSKNFNLNDEIDLINEIGKPYKEAKELLDYSIDVHKKLLQEKKDKEVCCYILREFINKNMLKIKSKFTKFYYNISNKFYKNKYEL